MSATVNGSVASSDQKQKPELQKQKSIKREGKTPRCTNTSCTRFRLLPKRNEWFPLKDIKHLGEKLVSFLQMMSPRRCSPKVTSSSSSSSERAAKPCVAAPVDSHRAEAIDDCIEFINSSSSLPRSNSTVQQQQT